jgi:hypothetical protein
VNAVIEINARIGPNDSIELADESGRIIGSAAQALTADAAIHLAKELLACAVASLSKDKLKPGTIIGYTELPIQKWKTMTSPHTGRLILILSVPPGIELVFGLTEEGAQEMGDALVFAAKACRSSGAQSGAVH